VELTYSTQEALESPSHEKEAPRHSSVKDSLLPMTLKILQISCVSNKYYVTNIF